MSSRGAAKERSREEIREAGESPLADHLAERATRSTIMHTAPFRSFAAPRLESGNASHPPTADAVGFILLPLRGYPRFFRQRAKRI
jgi:hypothetical protein